MATLCVVEFIFWLALAWIIYANVGYLLLLQLIAIFKQRPVTQADITPSISLLIAVHNEEKVIKAKLENSLALDYPPGKLQILIASDASTDRTDEIVQSFADRGVILNLVPDGKGKVNALDDSVPLATGEILVISDADSIYASDALRKLVRNFADPQVGAVTGEERRVAASGGEGLGESLYVRLDNRIKRLEGRIGSIVMVNGGFFAVRRVLYPVLEPYMIHDAVMPCQLQLQGYRTAYEPEAVSVETYALETPEDFRRRLRTVTQAVYSYLSVPAALNPLRTGFFAFEVLSHRFSRWLVLPWLAVALIANMALAPSSSLYRWLLIGQLICYALSSVGWLLDMHGMKVKLFYVPFYFVYIHTAAFIAVVQAILGKRIAVWQPTQRVSSEESAKAGEP